MWAAFFAPWLEKNGVKEGAAMEEMEVVALLFNCSVENEMGLVLKKGDSNRSHLFGVVYFHYFHMAYGI